MIRKKHRITPIENNTKKAQNAQNYTKACLNSLKLMDHVCIKFSIKTIFKDHLGPILGTNIN